MGKKGGEGDGFYISDPSQKGRRLRGPGERGAVEMRRSTSFSIGTREGKRKNGETIKEPATPKIWGKAYRKGCRPTIFGPERLEEKLGLKGREKKRQSSPFVQRGKKPWLPLRRAGGEIAARCDGRVA